MNNNIIENENINEATESTREVRTQLMKFNGKWVGLTPQGYLWARDEYGRASLVPDPERFDFIKSMLKALASGKCTIFDIKRAFDAVYITPEHKTIGGVKVKSISDLADILSRPVYAGLIADKNDPTVFHRGQHEPMITSDEWWEIRQKLGK